MLVYYVLLYINKFKYNYPSKIHIASSLVVIIIIIINSEFVLALFYLSLWLVKALRLPATPALLCSDRRCANSRPPHDVTIFEFWALQLFSWWRKREYPEETIAAWSESCGKLLHLWSQVSPSATGIRTRDHSAKCQVTNPLGHHAARQQQSYIFICMSKCIQNILLF